MSLTLGYAHNSARQVSHLKGMCKSVSTFVLAQQQGAQALGYMPGGNENYSFKNLGSVLVEVGDRTGCFCVLETHERRRALPPTHLLS